ncbi:MAG TPA: phosphodiester glycosidase family protein [Actinomycetota bacterium]|nr:phosphodiester glycosidase family protein [Actinomycetota bacterium]
MKKRLTAAALALVALIAAGTPGGARGYRERTQRIAPGVTYTSIKDPRGPFRIHVVSADLSRPSTFDVELARDKLPGFETTSSMAYRNNALVAINGDYARESGRPVMAFAEDGRLMQTPLVWGRNFAVNVTETDSYIGHPAISAWAYEPDVASLHSVQRMNEGQPGYSEMAAYTREGGREERPPTYACATRLYPTEAPRINYEHGGVEVNHYVDETSCSPSRVYPQGGTTIAAAMGSQREPEMAGFIPGEQVTLGWSLGWSGVFDTVGGNPTLVENGSISVQQENDPFFTRHPRTGVGSTPDGRILMVIVDGRRPGYSVGMTPRQFAKLFLSLGADWALNLDGGGSTTMTVNGRIVNRPSDGNERAVSSALLLLPGSDPGEVQPAPAESPAPLPLISPHDAAGQWRQIVRDPASTGGLASALMERGKPLPRSISRAARAFDRR